MKVIIIEDEHLSAQRLQAMLKKYDPSIEVLAELPSVEASVEWLKANESPDLVFMDIHLEDGQSFSIFETINLDVPVIFTTAFDEYMIRAFKVNSVDYLMKPLNYEELVAAIEKYIRVHGPGAGDRGPGDETAVPRAEGPWQGQGQSEKGPGDETAVPRAEGPWQGPGQTEKGPGDGTAVPRAEGPWHGPGQTESSSIEKLIRSLQKKEPEYRTRFLISIGSRLKTIEVADINYFYSADKITFLATNDNQRFPIDLSLDKLTAQLDPKFFFRVNRQMLVRLEAIENIHVFTKGRIKLDLKPAMKEDVFVTIDKVVEFKEWLGK